MTRLAATILIVLLVFLAIAYVATARPMPGPTAYHVSGGPIRAS